MSYKKRITWGRGARFWLVLLALVGIISLLALACGGDNEKKETPAAATSAATSSTAGKTATAKGPLKLGILFDFTGDLAEFGPNMLNGANLAAADINAAGGVLGQDIQLKQADSQTNPHGGGQRREATG